MKDYAFNPALHLSSFIFHPLRHRQHFRHHLDALRVGVDPARARLFFSMRTILPHGSRLALQVANSEKPDLTDHTTNLPRHRCAKIQTAGDMISLCHRMQSHIILHTIGNYSDTSYASLSGCPKGQKRLAPNQKGFQTTGNTSGTTFTDLASASMCTVKRTVPRQCSSASSALTVKPINCVTCCTSTDAAIVSSYDDFSCTSRVTQPQPIGQ